MNICLLSYRGNPYCGGQGIYLMYLAREFVRMGHNVHVITGPPYPFPEKGITIHHLDNHNYFNIRKNYIKPDRPFATFSPLNFYEFLAVRFGIFPEIETFSFRAFIKIRELMKTHSFDIIHDNQCLGYGFLLIQQLGVPFISTIHHPLNIDRSTWFEYPSDFSLKVKRVLYYPLIMQQFVSNRMEKIVTVSHDAAIEIHKAFKVKPEKIRVIYNGLDENQFFPVQSAKKRNSIIFVGNVEDRKKGVIYLLKALTLVNSEITLTIVDGGAPNRTFIPRLISKFGLNNRVVFTGKISNEQLLHLYAQHELAVFPSLYEGFGFPPAEAMACGLPVITTTAGALPEVVGKHGDTAYVVPPRDAEALADGISFLFDNPEQRKRMAEAGRNRIRSLFTWPNAAKELIELYEELINAHR